MIEDRERPDEHLDLGPIVGHPNPPSPLKLNLSIAPFEDRGGNARGLALAGLDQHLRGELCWLGSSRGLRGCGRGLTEQSQPGLWESLFGSSPGHRAVTRKALRRWPSASLRASSRPGRRVEALDCCEPEKLRRGADLSKGGQRYLASPRSAGNCPCLLRAPTTCGMIIQREPPETAQVFR